MTYKAIVEKWLSYPELDAELKQQLISMQHNEKALEESFYKNLEFGTGGMRGEIGPGTNHESDEYLYYSQGIGRISALYC